MCGAVLNPLNYRLDARTLTFMLGHAEAKILIVDREYSKLVSGVLDSFPPEKRPFVVDVDDPLCTLTWTWFRWWLVASGCEWGSD